MSPSSVSAPVTSEPPTRDSAGEPILELEGLYHKWKGPRPPVLDDVSLSLHQGQVTWIGGPPAPRRSVVREPRLWL